MRKRKANWWSSSSGRVELEIPVEAVEDIAQSGRNDEAVSFWLPKIDFSSYTEEVLNAELYEYGLDDSDSRQHIEERLLWIAAWDIAEEAE